MLLFGLQEADHHRLQRHEPFPRTPAEEPASASPGAPAVGAAGAGGAAEGVCNRERRT